MPLPAALLCVFLTIISSVVQAAEPSPVDAQLTEYFRAQTQQLGDQCLATIHSAADWHAQRPTLQQQLLEMLGLEPLPEKTELQATVTGRVDRDDFYVEKVHFQSRPHLYVTGNLYLPKNMPQPVPAVLYLCGHGGVKIDGISYGNKVHYQHHGAWFARHGYACLIIDSLQLGEIEGLHHGTHHLDSWWWACRGYTPAGVEAWNCVRAIDYLQSRPEIDGSRIGATGRSGGGAYSWWIAAIDERITATVPVAGITDLQDHVIDGCVDGHCDCMYFVNTYRWDYPAVAALVAPRPLLISNTDRDGIFPLDGVVRTHERVRHIYDLVSSSPENLGLNISPGPHKDTQELQVHAFRWLNHHLKKDDSPVEKTAVPFFTPQELKVFDQLPADSLNAQIADTFVPAAAPLTAPESSQQWTSWKSQWMEQLRTKTFQAWPERMEPKLTRLETPSERAAIGDAYELTTQTHVQLPLFIRQEGQAVRHVLVINEQEWQQIANAQNSANFRFPADTFAVVIPRGIGPARWSGDAARQNQIARRFYLLGETIEGMQVWDVRQALAALRGRGHGPLIVHASGRMAGVALYAALFEPGIEQLHLTHPPRSHRDGPTLLNVQRFMDLPHAMALAAEQTRVVVYDNDPEHWQAVAAVRDSLNWPANQFEVQPLANPSPSSVTEPPAP